MYVGAHMFVFLFNGCLCAGMIVHLSVCVCATAYHNVCVCLGKDAQHGVGQGLGRGSGSGQSVTADPTVRGFFVSGVFSGPLSATYSTGISFW